MKRSVAMKSCNAFPSCNRNASLTSSVALETSFDDELLWRYQIVPVFLVSTSAQNGAISCVFSPSGKARGVKLDIAARKLMTPFVFTYSISKIHHLHQVSLIHIHCMLSLPICCK